MTINNKEQLELFPINEVTSKADHPVKQVRIFLSREALGKANIIQKETGRSLSNILEDAFLSNQQSQSKAYSNAPTK